MFPNCKDGRVIADIVKLQKGHTEGYEPNVTDKIIELAVSAKGGKDRDGLVDAAASAAAAKRTLRLSRLPTQSGIAPQAAFRPWGARNSLANPSPIRSTKLSR